jgi:hypothetical protein
LSSAKGFFRTPTSLDLVNEVLSTDVLLAMVRMQASPDMKFGPDSLLTALPQPAIPFGSRFIQLYLLAFLSAEAAFIFMDIREYLQDLVGFSELDLIRGANRNGAGQVVRGSG